MFWFTFGHIDQVDDARIDLSTDWKPVPRAILTQNIIRILGVVLTVVGLAFTTYIIVESGVAQRPGWGLRSYLVLSLGCSSYAVLSALLIVVWVCVLDTFAPDALNAREAFEIYAASQIMKYLPSNVLHFVGRHVVLRRRGVSHLALICTVFGESGILVVGAMLAVLLLDPGMLLDVYKRYMELNGLAVGLVLTTMLATLAAGVLWVAGTRYRALVAASLDWRIVGRALVALGSAGAFFTSTTLLTATICGVLLDAPDFGPSRVAAALAAAWVVGFVIPGASAGIGVRESAVILLLMPTTGPGNAAAIATIYRLITAGGDVLLAGFGVLARHLSAARTPGEN
jgi:glycosyltransferase 2 family protein